MCLRVVTQVLLKCDFNVDNGWIATLDAVGGQVTWLLGWTGSDCEAALMRSGAGVLQADFRGDPGGEGQRRAGHSSDAGRKQVRRE